MRKALLVVGLLLAPALLVAWTQEPPKKGRNLLMQQKLTHAQKVLEGVAVQDFDLIAKHADELVLISKKAEWMVVQTPDYVRNSNEFRRTCDQLVQQAKQKNVDGAALAYVQMTMTCVNCHKYVRESRIAAIPTRHDGTGLGQ